MPDSPALPADSTAAQLKLAGDLVNIVFWRHDLVTNRLHYDDHGCTVLGIPHCPGGLRLEESRAYTHPDDVPKLAASAAQALLTDVPVDVETRHRRGDGIWRNMLVRRVVERNAAGEAVAFVGVSLDVTDRVEHTRRTEHLAQRLEAAAAAARMGIWSSLTGGGGTEWNAQMHVLFDMVGEPAPVTLADALHRCIHPDDATRVEHATRAYLAGAPGGFEIEFRTRHRSDGTRWIVLRADTVAGPATQAAGRPIRRIFGVAMDVTERHRAAAALHTASARAALIASSAGIGTWEATLDEGQARWDAQMYRLRGLQPRAGAPSRDERLALVHADDRKLLLDSLPDLHAAPHSVAYEFRVRLPDGNYRWLASRSALLRDEHGTALRRVGVNWDISDAREAEQTRQKTLLAQRESQAKSQFMSRMSHELRTPLNAVLGFTQLLQAEARHAAPDGWLEKLGHVRAAGEHLLALIDDVLDLSSLETGALRLSCGPVSLGATVAQALPMVQAAATKRGVRLRAGALSGTALADPMRLQQVLLNLLTHAIESDPAHGQVVVESQDRGERVVLRVRHRRTGLRAEPLERLFEPFSRPVSRPVSERDGCAGTGISLTISRALVEGMGGTLTAFGEADHGVVFEVTLATSAAAPIVVPSEAAPGHATSTSTAAGAAPAPGTQRCGQLLYIEDNEVNVLLVEALVRSVPGLCIACESTGAQGVARAGQLQPDLILVDMQLPDFDGFEVLRRLRAQPQTATTPCIALSANALAEDIARGLEAGFDDYWTKPIRFKPFLEALERRFPARAA